ncbi:hypothetical protein C8024_05910 [Sphingopyxis sp. BSNA05]|uniref:hypothetical protein n=1 Tax=Sphingopyxis sp. BSNA05 TaxID=1236614 RepID=UPI001564C3C3|nr:hypothetical protein [Sphingopyxis sp. BSNA05]NRD89080.1 hypothetical protein [Sphingopyxis sp. BSNA05]
MNRKFEPGYLALFASTAIAGVAGWGLSSIDATDTSNIESQMSSVTGKQASLQPIKMQSKSGSVADVVQAVQPAVVSITVEQKTRTLALVSPAGEAVL